MDAATDVRSWRVGTALDRPAEHGSRADLHDLLSPPVPVLVICELLGVPYADRDRFRALFEGAGRLRRPRSVRPGPRRLRAPRVRLRPAVLQRRRARRVELPCSPHCPPASRRCGSPWPVEDLELRTDLLTGGLKELPVRW